MGMLSRIPNLKCQGFVCVQHSQVKPKCVFNPSLVIFKLIRHQNKLEFKTSCMILLLCLSEKLQIILQTCQPAECKLFLPENGRCFCNCLLSELYMCTTTHGSPARARTLQWRVQLVMVLLTGGGLSCSKVMQHCWVFFFFF